MNESGQLNEVYSFKSEKLIMEIPRVCLAFLLVILLIFLLEVSHNIKYVARYLFAFGRWIVTFTH